MPVTSIEYRSGTLEGWGPPDRFDARRVRNLVEEVRETTGMRAWRKSANRMVLVAAKDLTALEKSRRAAICFSINDPSEDNENAYFVFFEVIEQGLLRLLIDFFPIEESGTELATTLIAQSGCIQGTTFPVSNRVLYPEDPPYWGVPREFEFQQVKSVDSTALERFVIRREFATLWLSPDFSPEAFVELCIPDAAVMTATNGYRMVDGSKLPHRHRLEPLLAIEMSPYLTLQTHQDS
jgi:hypothetical protein